MPKNCRFFRLSTQHTAGKLQKMAKEHKKTINICLIQKKAVPLRRNCVVCACAYDVRNRKDV